MQDVTGNNLRTNEKNVLESTTIVSRQAPKSGIRIYNDGDCSLKSSSSRRVEGRIYQTPEYDIIYLDNIVSHKKHENLINTARANTTKQLLTSTCSSLV